MNVREIFEKKLDQVITEYAKEEAKFKKEACGIITKDFKFISCKNQHEDPENYFSFNPAQVEGLVSSDIGMIFHSHISENSPGFLSFQDLEAARGFGSCPEKYPYLLYHTVFEDWDYYDSNLVNPFPLSPYFPKPCKLSMSEDPKRWEYWAGLPFVWGRTDCFGLIRHYFLALGIDIGDFRRPSIEQQKSFPDLAWKSPWDGESHDFVVMSPGEPMKQHDIFEIAQRGGLESNHIAVCVDVPRLQILHNPGVVTANKANVELYGKHWESRTTKHLRHKSFVKS